MADQYSPTASLGLDDLDIDAAVAHDPHEGYVIDLNVHTPAGGDVLIVRVNGDMAWKGTAGTGQASAS